MRLRDLHMARWLKSRKKSKALAESDSPTATVWDQSAPDSSTAAPPLSRSAGTNTSIATDAPKEAPTVNNAETIPKEGSAISPEPGGTKETPKAANTTVASLHSPDSGEGSTPPKPNVASVGTQVALKSPSPSLPDHTPEEQASGFWDKAYDHLKNQEPSMLHDYEVIISDHLARYSPDLLPNGRNIVAQSDPSIRRAQMSDLVNKWMGELNQDTVNELDGEDQYESKKANDIVTTDQVHTLKRIMRETVEAYPFASIAWAPLCLAIEELLHSPSQHDAMRSQTISIVTGMEWYLGLSKLFFWSGDDDDALLPSNASAMTLVNLYEVILKHSITIVSFLEEDTDHPRPDYDIYMKEVRYCETQLKDNFHRQELADQLDRSLPTQQLSDTKSNQGESTSETGSSVEDDTQELLVRFSRDPASPFAEQDPRSQTDKSNALKQIYEWACGTEEFKRLLDWDTGSSCRVLWINGDPGAGKTMLLTAAVQKLPDSTRGGSNVAFFFGSTGRENELSVIKGLISRILTDQPYLVHHLRDKVKRTGREDFDSLSDFYAVSTIFYSLIQDDQFSQTYFIIDAVDQFAVDEDSSMNSPLLTVEEGPKKTPSQRALNDLLNLISISSELSNKVKWLLSLDRARCDVTTVQVGEGKQLRLNMSSGSHAVRKIAQKFAASKVEDVAIKEKYGVILREALVSKLQEVSPGNFMWVDMALDYVTVKASSTPWNAPKILGELKESAPDVESLYGEGMDIIEELEGLDQDYCMSILSTAAVAYRPLLVSELVEIINLPRMVDPVTIVDKVLSPFLRISADKVVFRHLSARDFIRRKLKEEGVSTEHSKMVKRCLKVLLGAINHTRLVHSGESGANSGINYVTIFWIKHLSEVVINDREALVSAKPLLDTYLIRWLRILDSQNLLQGALGMMATLTAVLTAQSPTREFMSVDVKSAYQSIHDAARFMQLHQSRKSSLTRDDRKLGGSDTMRPENSLLFSPSETPPRKKLLKEYYPWLATPPVIELSSDLSSCLHVLKHPDWVRSCVFSPDGTLVASASDDRQVRLWDVQTGKLQHVFEAFDGYATDLAISRTGPKGRAVIAAIESEVIKVWELPTGRLLKKLPEVRGTDEDTTSEDSLDFSYVRSVALSPTGDRLAAALRRNVVIWETHNFTRISMWVGNEDAAEDVRCVRFSPDGKLLASSAGPDITVWECETGKRLHKLPDRAVVAQDDKTLESRIAGGHKEDIDGLAFSPDSKFLASGSDDATARVWNLQTGKTSALLRFHNSHVNSLSFSSTGTHLATASSDTTIGIWQEKAPGDWGSGEEREQPDKVLRGHKGYVRSVSFAPWGNLLASGSHDGTCRVWDTAGAEETPTKAQSGSDQAAETTAVSSAHKKSVRCVAISQDGELVASASTDSIMCLWDGKTGALLSSDNIPGGNTTSLVFSEDATRLLSASTDSVARIWNVNRSEGTIKLTFHLDGHSNWLRYATFSPSGRLVATASDDRTVGIWEMPSGTSDTQEENPIAQSVFEGHKDYVFSVAFSPDETRLASAGDDLHVMIWNLAGKGEKQVNKDKPDKDLSHSDVRDYIRAVVFSADGRMVVSASKDSTIAFWNLDVPADQQACIMMISENIDPGPYKSMQPDGGYPDILVTELGSWIVGRVDLDSAKAKAASDLPVKKPWMWMMEQRARWHPFAISNDCTWILWRENPLIYLPTQFRPERGLFTCRIHGRTVVIGSATGQVLLFRFSEDADPRLDKLFSLT
ncbi:hypothetical protein GGR52DRAFT_509172 [Hypoxylon sp. FL1284]|nr:hypothetical protein GGR52DRAFT_509172 [Hypoxylon sp. FL1284]